MAAALTLVDAAIVGGDEREPGGVGRGAGEGDCRTDHAQPG